MRRIAGTLLVAAVIAACSNSSSAVAPSPSPSPQATPTPVFLCRLPVAVWNYPNSDTGGGFIGYPGGVFTSDPGATMTLSDGLIHSPGPPALIGTGDVGSVAYDSPQRRWLPVPLQWVLPGGAQYAYTLPNAFGPSTGVHLVDVASGRDELVPGSGKIGGSEAIYEMNSATADGIYLQGSGHAGPLQGLWLLDLRTGRITFKARVGWSDVQVTGGAAWWGGAENEDPGFAAPGTLYRTPLTPGAATKAWFTRPGLRLNMLGFDASGQPLVEAYSLQVVELWRITGQNAGIRLASSTGTYDVPARYYSGVVSDSNGTWIGGSFGVFLLQPGRSLIQLSSMALRVAGPCS
jgi:hypothetical protein